MNAEDTHQQQAQHASHRKEAMFLTILFAHHKSLRELHDKLDRAALPGRSVGKAEEST